MKVSVIIPIYNMECYLQECLNSLLLQALKDLEIICINDGSFDKSQEILSEFAWKDKRIIVINQKNAGVSAARNAGIKKARGEYLYFLDPDDYLPDENMLLDMYKAAKDNNALICGGGFREDAEGGEISKWHGNLCKYSFAENGVIQYKDYQFDYGFTRFIYNREFIVDNQLFFPQRIFFEDPVFLVKAMSLAGQFYAMKRCTYCYRTGHKTMNWRYEQVVDLLNGMKDNISLAKVNSYTDLMLLERARLENDYMEAILKFLCTSNNSEMIKLLNDINLLLFEDGGKVEYYMYERKIKNVEYACWIENMNKDDIFKNSTTWKVGNSILALPKFLRKMLKGGK